MINVSEIIESTEFNEAFTVTRTTTRIVNGVPVDTVIGTFPQTGVVAPSKTSLQYTADGTRLSASIDVFTTNQLQTAYKIDDTSSRKADIINWRGRQYVVNVSQDYSHFGYYLSVADLIQVGPTKETL